MEVWVESRGEGGPWAGGSQIGVGMVRFSGMCLAEYCRFYSV